MRHPYPSAQSRMEKARWKRRGMLMPFSNLQFSIVASLDCIIPLPAWFLKTQSFMSMLRVRCDGFWSMYPFPSAPPPNGESRRAALPSTDNILALKFAGV